MVVVRGGSRLTTVRATPWRQVADRFSLKGRLVFHIGGDAPHKNTRLVVEAVKQLWSEDVEVSLVVAGVKNSARFGGNRSGKRGSIQFLPYISDRDLKALYQNASLLAFVSQEEGYGEPVVEAMKEGLPLVLTNIPVFREIANHAAIYVDGTSTSIASAIAKLLNNASLRDELAQRSAQRGTKLTETSAEMSFLNAVSRIIGAEG